MDTKRTAFSSSSWRRAASTTATTRRHEQQASVHNVGNATLAAPQTHEERLWSYVSNLSKARKETNHTARTKALRPILNSYLGFLTADAVKLQQIQEEALESSLIQALRAAGDMGDYRLIFKLLSVDSTSSWLSPRVYGEAIASMSATSANVSKLKQLWEQASSIQSSELTAFELNMMIQALAKRGRIRAALELYQTSNIVGDTYTLSTLISALAESIADHQQVAKDWSFNKQQQSSPCWQYNEAYQLLQQASIDHLNNVVFGAALKLNDRAGQVYSNTSESRHYASQHAMELLQLMKERQISPDVVTCSAVLSTFDKGYQWKAAVALLDSMSRQESNESSSWRLPAPNTYAYASTISACAKCQEYETAMQLLERLKTSTSERPNTWVYNAALAACVSKSRHGRSSRVDMAQKLLDQMRQGAEEGLDTAPDTVSYNTVLAVLEGCSRDDVVDLVGRLLQDMKEQDLDRDSITYRNAVKTVRHDGAAVLEMVDVAVSELSTEACHGKGRASEGVQAVFQTALSALSFQDEFGFVEMLFRKMKGASVLVDSASFSHLISALGRSDQPESILLLLKGLGGDKDAFHAFETLHALELRERSIGGEIPCLELKHCSTAIASFLDAKDMDRALKVLSFMREKGLTPDDQSMQAISLAYCRLAAEAAAEETRIGRKRQKAKKPKRNARMDEVQSLSSSRAQSAMTIAFAMKEPSNRLLSALATSCSAAGLWDDARTILRRIHDRYFQEQQSSFSFMDDRSNSNQLGGLHRSLLKICASRGNATAAVNFVDDIQNISQRLSSTEELPTSVSVLLDEFSEESVEESMDGIVPSLDASSYGREIGMDGEDWKLLLIAASKSGHWKLCLGTLQFLRPFLEALHPEIAGHDHKASRQYEKLARSLTAAVLCFEMRSQYAWAVRAIDDWIQWSGRRPRAEAVVAACRILAARGQGYEVNRLVSRVLQVATVGIEEDDSLVYGAIVCAGALNALHSHGLYEDSDELFVQAYSQKLVPFEVERDDGRNEFILDLHGMNVAMANSAVRIALQQQVLPENWKHNPDSPSFVEETPRETDMVIITGRGMNSAQRLRPILRPEVQRMLLEEFYPPLSTTSTPGNMGALRVPAQDVKAWVMHQRQQKGARMLAVADVLKELSSGDRIRRALERRRPEREEEEEQES